METNQLIIYQKMKLRITGISFLLVLASVFISNTIYGQKIMVQTESEDSEVFLNNVKMGAGLKVPVQLLPNIPIQQLRIERKGYKTEYTVASKKEKLIVVRNNKRYAIKEDGLNRMVISGFKIDSSFSKIEISVYNYRDFMSGQKSKMIYVPCYDNLGFNGVNFDIIQAFKSGMYSTGYVDTNVTTLRLSNNKLFLKATLYNLEFFPMQLSYKCNTNCITLETQVEYEVKDIYNNILLSKMVESKSGIFNLAAYNWFTAHGGVQSDLVTFAIQDAIENGFLETVMDPTSLKLFKEEEKLISKDKPKLNLNTTKAVSDMASAKQATVTVKSKNGFGSGCIISNDGYILTSYHVVDGLEDSLITISLSTGETLKAKMDRTSKTADLVLLKVERTFPFAFNIKSDLVVEVADEVYAIGTPAALDLKQSVSSGIISGLRTSSDGLSLIQSDVPVSSGNSGGPLLKKNGDFLGVVSSKISGKGNEGLAFCTPMKDIINFLNLDVK